MLFRSQTRILVKGKKTKIKFLNKNYKLKLTCVFPLQSIFFLPVSLMHRAVLAVCIQVS